MYVSCVDGDAEASKVSFNVVTDKTYLLPTQESLQYASQERPLESRWFLGIPTYCDSNMSLSCSV